jgi:hypothetical protein
MLLHQQKNACSKISPDYPWPRHMAEKDWVDIDEFTTAWPVALVLHRQANRLNPTTLLKLFGKLRPRTIR